VTQFKLGKTPARHEAVKFKFTKYANLSVLPAVPSGDFGHEKMVTHDWGMLGNDTYGCCVWSGGDHEEMVWNAEGAHPVIFTTQNTLADYAACTGFDPNNPDSDQGTDMQVAASYRQKTGLLDANGNRHKVGAYVALRVGDLQELYLASYIFGAVGVGIEVPASAQDQFGNEPWSVVPGSSIEGGHYVPMVARRSGLIQFLTWGAEQAATEQFYTTYNDESLCYISQEMLTGGKTLEGFDIEQLNADLAALQQKG